MKKLSDQRQAGLKDRMSAIEGIRRGLESVARGEGIPLDEFERKMRQRLRSLQVRQLPHK